MSPVNDNARRQPGEGDTAKGSQQPGSCQRLVHAAKPKKVGKKYRGNRWQRYEQLKAQYTEQAATSFEYEAACRRAAKESGV